MTDIKISDLPAGMDADGTEMIVVVQGGATARVTPSQLFKALATYVSAADLRTHQIGTGSVQRTVLDELRDTVSVKQFGAKGDGVTDDTAAIAAAYAFVKGRSLYYNLVFPPGRYLTTSQFVFTDCYFGSFHMQGAAFVGGSASTPYDSVVKVVNAENFKIHGAWSVTADSHFTGATADPNLYGCGFYLTTAPGGAFSPIAAYVDIYGLTAHHCALGVKVGEYTNDSQIAEVTFHGLMTPFCPSGVYVGGSQAVVAFVGSQIDSNTVSNFSPPLTSPTYCALLVEGSEVNILGGEIGFHSGTPAGAAAIQIQPCSSSTFGNQYGSVQVDNANLESTTTLALISNPRALSSPGSTLGGFTATNCKGYFGNLPTGSIAVVDIEDASFAGTIAIPDGNLFYYNAGVRTVSQINATLAPAARIAVGKTAFHTASGFLDWMNGVAGGQLIHAVELGFYAYVNSGTQPTGINPIVWNSVSTSGVYARYRGLLNTSTGIITAPTGNPPRMLRIEASVQVGSSNSTGNIYVYDITNGRIVSFGVISGGLAAVSATIPNPSPGQQFAVYLNVPNSIAWGGSVTNNLAVYVGN
ncbi:MAG: glycosyl hydrolase family 28-related protein [Dokdonella sp.]|uniref:glycosyl hydrolase family 28-related protein n=1 Tax=Dokdonella sp. TaxID=2291710 RepID=UPI003F81C939